MPKAKYHIIRLAAGQECPAGYTSRSVRGATVCTKKMEAMDVAPAAAPVVDVAEPANEDAAVDELANMFAAALEMKGPAAGEEVVVEWGGEGMNMEGGRRHHRKSRKAGRKGASRRKSHKKSHRKSRRQH
jgi:hypothetical protein